MPITKLPAKYKNVVICLEHGTEYPCPICEDSMASDWYPNQEPVVQLKGGFSIKPSRWDGPNGWRD